MLNISLNMSRVNNKDSRMTSFVVVLMSLRLSWNILKKTIEHIKLMLVSITLDTCYAGHNVVGLSHEFRDME